jgi:hypothetical protein
MAERYRIYRRRFAAGKRPSAWAGALPRDEAGRLRGERESGVLPKKWSRWYESL